MLVIFRHRLLPLNNPSGSRTVNCAKGGGKCYRSNY